MPPGILALAGRSGRNPVTTTLALFFPNTDAPIAKLLPSGQPQALAPGAGFVDHCGKTVREGICAGRETAWRRPASKAGTHQKPGEFAGATISPRDLENVITPALAECQDLPEICKTKKN